MSPMEQLCKRIDLKKKPLDNDLFDKKAKEAAEIIARSSRDENKYTQLRRFYDEVILWESKVIQQDSKDHTASVDTPAERLRECLPFIHMINAKAAYAQGRGLVSANFVHLLSACIDQIGGEPEVLRHFKLFFEAFMGFYKVHRPSD